MSKEPRKIWWTPQEIAEASLPDLPSTKRGVQKVAERFGWASMPGMAKRRAGRGGGMEFHWSVFPARAKDALLAHESAEEAKPKPTMSWDWFEQQPDKARDTARARLQVLQRVEMLIAQGMVKDAVVRQIADLHSVSPRTIWNWFGMVDGIPEADRLPNLCPRPRGGASNSSEYDDEFWDWLKSDYLRLEGPKFSACYRRAVRVANKEGWKTAPERTMRRVKDAEISPLTEILAREGVDALKRRYPPQTRDRVSLHAMEAVNADYHRFDVFVRWPAEPGASSDEGDIVRPQLVAFQDLYSGRILSWRLDRTPNKVGVSLALGDLIERFGIPYHVLLDNGREFANKFLTGGVKTRFRFKVKDDDIPGILTTLGVKVHWATPYSGQSKPIERAFRDLAEDIAKDPRLAGAYTGNRPDAKPENYGSRAVPLEDFIRIVEEGIEEHNSRAGRRGQTTMGRSILETFELSYAEAPIRKATPEQCRLWLMGAEGLRADRNTGLLKFMGNEYYSEWMHELAGKKVVARFDPADLRAGLHLYSLDGRYLGLADCRVAAGFFDIEEAQQLAAARRRFVKAEKATLEALGRLNARELGAALDAARPGELKPAPVEAKVVRPTFNKPVSVPQPAPDAPEEQAQRSAFVASFEAKKSQQPEVQEDQRARFARALELEARIKDGEAVHRDQERWLSGYQTTAEYKAAKKLHETFNKDVSG